MSDDEQTRDEIEEIAHDGPFQELVQETEIETIIEEEVKPASKIQSKGKNKT